MAELMDYLHWRGDLRFSQDPPNEVDALIFSVLAYVRFADDVQKHPAVPVPLREAAKSFLALPDQKDRVRVKDDIQLLKAAAETQRFGGALVCHYRDILIPEEDTQFAAVTFLLDDGSAFLAFRGTDYSIAGWKEDFNMSFRYTVPAQQLALDYLREIAAQFLLPFWLGGHSKGGNLAMFAAIHSGEQLRRRILGVFNNDGPGFREHVTQNPAYQEMIPLLHTFVPQSSVVGLLLEHEEPFTIVKSRQLGILQHEIHSWELDGPRFVREDDLTADSRFLNLTIRNWLDGMDVLERNEAVEAIFELLEAGNAENLWDLLKPQSIISSIRVMSRDEKIRKVLGGEFLSLIEAAKKAIDQRENEQK